MDPSNVSDIFTNSYLRHLKQPRFGNYEPDQAYGANMLPRSQNQNPNPVRNAQNAVVGASGGGGLIPGINTGNMSAAGSTFQNLMAQSGTTAVNFGTKSLSNWAAPKLWDYLKSIGKPGEAFMDTMKGSVGTNATLGAMTKAPMFSELGGVEKLGQSLMENIPKPSEAVGAVGDATSSTAGYMPVVGSIAKLGLKAGTGELQKHPWETGGEAAGTAIGAGVGSIVPGVGTAIGAGLGGIIGKTAGEAIHTKDPSKVLLPIESPALHGQFGTSGVKLVNPLYDSSKPMASMFMPGLARVFGGSKAPEPMQMAPVVSDQVNTQQADNILSLLNTKPEEYTDLYNWF